MRKLFIFFISLILLMLTSAPTIYAQNETSRPDTSWTVEKVCIGKPTRPPPDWSYDGTVLFRGKYGIHGLRRDWAVPHVLAFLNSLNNQLGDGNFSSDLKYYAAPVGISRCGAPVFCTDTYTRIKQLRIFDVTGRQPRDYKSFHLELDYYASAEGYDEPYIVWVNDHQLLYPVYPPMAQNTSDTTLIDIVKGNQEIIAQDSPLICSRCSPDYSRQLTYISGSLVLNFKDDPSHKRLPLALSNDLVVSDLGENWTNNSQHFLAMRSYEPLGSYLVEYDRDGKLLGQVSPALDITLEDSFYPSSGFYMNWSPNSDFIWLNIGSSGSVTKGFENIPKLKNSTYIIDLREHKAYDLCTSSLRGKWSPDSRYFAFSRNEDVMIYDVKAHVAYQVVDYPKEAFSPVIGWRGD